MGLALWRADWAGRAFKSQPELRHPVVTHNISQVRVVRFLERVDSLSAPGVEVEMQQLVSGGARRLVCDLTATQYISSAGLRVILAVAKALRQQGGQLRLACGKVGYVYEVLQTSGFTSIIPVHETVAEAVEQMQ